ncbi:hypothetical protein UY3_02404 [Chelonia mydas]|uniref:Uncharacterized protein n=1 Tax=Chelonia mydas TaxID=8469 RepID=M7C7A6_CHEMY|nr:hypothetical protein UY3_02404 [Chelonia mydas]
MGEHQQSIYCSEEHCVHSTANPEDHDRTEKEGKMGRKCEYANSSQRIPVTSTPGVGKQAQQGRIQVCEDPDVG